MLTHLKINKTRFLPAGAEKILRQWMLQIIGLLLVLLSIAMLCALGSFSSFDPSFNVVTQKPVQNVMGIVGSYFSDLVLQIFGVAGFVGVASLGVWGNLLLFGHKINYWPLRLSSLFLSLLLFGICFSLIPSQIWGENLSYFAGGSFGYLLSKKIAIWILAKPITYISSVIGLFSLSILFLIVSLQIPLRYISTSVLTIGWLLKWSFDFFSKILGKNKPLFNKANRYSQEPSFLNKKDEFSYDEDEQESFATPKNPVVHMFPNKEGHNIDSPINENEHEIKSSKTLTQAASSQVRDFSEFMETGGYTLPPHDLLQLPVIPLKKKNNISKEDLAERAKELETVLSEYGVRGEILDIKPGPVVTLYELKPAPGIKTSRVISLADDIARSMSALSVRIATVPGRNVIGIELPNPIRETVFLKEMLQTLKTSHEQGQRLPLILGKDIGGQPIVADLARMPHLLVAGTTGSGKSVSINTMILSVLFQHTPEECKFIMVDPKMLELSVYDDIPHLLTPVVTDPKKAVIALRWAVKEMENRYRSMAKLGVRNIDGYNVRVQEARLSGELLMRRIQTGFDPESGKPVFEDQAMDLQKLPYIVVVVDEMADLMLVAGKEIEGAVQRLAQMARAAGIHLIMATQRPSVDVITGTIKANFPTRISFQVTSKIDSRTILGEQGAEQLLGQGDMLYMAGGGRITRIHGPFVKDDEVETIVQFLKTQGEPAYIESVTEDEEGLFGEETKAFEESDKANDLYRQAVDLVVREGKASTSFVQRHFQIGYNRAARLIEQMEKEGVISKANHVGKRDVLMGG